MSDQNWPLFLIRHDYFGNNHMSNAHRSFPNYQEKIVAVESISIPEDSQKEIMVSIVE